MTRHIAYTCGCYSREVRPLPDGWDIRNDVTSATIKIGDFRGLDSGLGCVETYEHLCVQCRDALRNAVWSAIRERREKEGSGDEVP